LQALSFNFNLMAKAGFFSYLSVITGLKPCLCRQAGAV